jgi:hypothetical protein
LNLTNKPSTSTSNEQSASEASQLRSRMTEADRTAAEQGTAIALLTEETATLRQRLVGRCRLTL